MDMCVYNFTQRCQITADLVSMQTAVLKCPLKSVVERYRNIQRFKTRRGISQVEEKGRRRSQCLFHSHLSALWSAKTRGFCWSALFFIYLLGLSTNSKGLNQLPYAFQKKQISFVCNVFPFPQRRRTLTLRFFSVRCKGEIQFVFSFISITETAREEI